MMRLERVVEIVARHFGLTVAVLLGRGRQQSVGDARHVAMFLARELCGWSYPELGAGFGRDHSTIMAGTAKVRAKLTWDDRFRSIVRGARAELPCPTRNGEPCEGDKACAHCGVELDPTAKYSEDKPIPFRLREPEEEPAEPAGPVGEEPTSEAKRWGVELDPLPKWTTRELEELSRDAHARHEAVLYTPAWLDGQEAAELVPCPVIGAPLWPRG